MADDLTGSTTGQAEYRINRDRDTDCRVIM